jgi:hypothetical protein
MRSQEEIKQRIKDLTGVNGEEKIKMNIKAKTYWKAALRWVLKTEYNL